MSHTKRVVELTRQIEEARANFPWVRHTDLWSGTIQFSGGPRKTVSLSDDALTMYGKNWQLTTPLTFRLLFVLWIFMGGKLTRVKG